MSNSKLSLLVGAALVVPSLAFATTGNIVPADMRTTPAPNTLQQKIQGPDSELIATQPGEIDYNRNNLSTDSTMKAPHSSMANRGNIVPADARMTSAPNTLQQKIQGPDGELLATQPGEIDFNQQRLKTDRYNGNYQPLILGEGYNTGNVTPADRRLVAVPITL